MAHEHVLVTVICLCPLPSAVVRACRLFFPLQDTVLNWRARIGVKRVGESQSVRNVLASSTSRKPHLWISVDVGTLVTYQRSCLHLCLCIRIDCILLRSLDHLYQWAIRRIDQILSIKFCPSHPSPLPSYNFYCCLCCRFLWLAERHQCKPKTESHRMIKTFQNLPCFVIHLRSYGS